MKKYIFKDLIVIFDEHKSSFISIYNKLLNKEYIYEEVPLFRIKLRGKSANKIIVGSEETSLIFNRKNTMVYHHELFDFKLVINPIDDGFKFNFSIKNHTDKVIEWVEIPSIGLNPKLKDEVGGEGSVLFNYNEGSLVTNMARRNASPFPYIEPDYPSIGKTAVFPNMIGSQFISYQSDNFGIYIGLHDPNRGIKHIDFRSNKNSLQLVTKVFTGSNYGSDYILDFPIVMKFFDGDIYSSLDIYRGWFNRHLPNGAIKLKDNIANLPRWYLNNPVVIISSIRGRYDTDKMEPTKLFPYDNAFPLLENYRRDLNSNILYLMMHYEGSAPWAPPIYFPPYGGIKLFTDFVKKAHSNGFYIGLYCSGFGYTVKSNLVASYDKSESFIKDNIKDLICTDSDYSYSSTICKAQRDGYDLCPGNDKTKKLFVDEMDKVINSGVDYAQALDQNHGGCSYFCYSDKHNHPPVPGSWSQKEVCNTIDQLNNQNHILLGAESGASEPFISRLLFSDNRFNLNYYIGLPFPIYSYLYHEYLHNFMGNQICMTLSKEEYNYSYRLAYSFVIGDNLSFVMNDEGNINYAWCMLDTVNKENAIKALRNFNSWRINRGYNYLNFGKMIKPIETKTNYLTFKCEDSTVIKVKGIQEASYIYNGKKVQILANYQLNPAVVELTKPYKVYLDSKDDKYIISDKITIEPLSAVMVEIN